MYIHNINYLPVHIRRFIYIITIYTLSWMVLFLCFSELSCYRTNIQEVGPFLICEASFVRTQGIAVASKYHNKYFNYEV